MCLTPKAQAATSQAATSQAATMPGAAPTQRRRTLGGLAGGTLLTSPSGVSMAATTSGANTLLGA
ncbi:MAG: hypothetical protein ACO27H_09905 [Burkholderiaceae bacterium]